MKERGDGYKREKEQKLARERVSVILQVCSGVLTAKEGKLLGVSRKTYLSLHRCGWLAHDPRDGHRHHRAQAGGGGAATADFEVYSTNQKASCYHFIVMGNSRLVARISLRDYILRNPIKGTTDSAAIWFACRQTRATFAPGRRARLFSLEQGSPQ